MVETLLTKNMTAVCEPVGNVFDGVYPKTFVAVDVFEHGDKVLFFL
jgi:hypothetical protein